MRPSCAAFESARAFIRRNAAASAMSITSGDDAGAGGVASPGSSSGCCGPSLTCRDHAVARAAARPPCPPRGSNTRGPLLGTARSSAGQTDTQDVSSSHLRAYAWRPVLPAGWERRVVAAAAEIISPSPTWTLTQAQFDKVRLQAAQGPCPRARQLQRRVGMPWRHLVAEAVGSPITTATPEFKQPPVPSRHGPWTRLEVFLAVEEFRRWAGDRKPTVALYRTWCRSQTGRRPWPRSLARHGGLPTLLDCVERGSQPLWAAQVLERARTPLTYAVGYQASRPERREHPVDASALAAELGVSRRAVAERLTVWHDVGVLRRRRRPAGRRAGREPFEYWA